MNIPEDLPHKLREDSILPIWRQAFRPFFLAGSLFSIIALITWLGVLRGWVILSPYGNVLFWHGHEMLFGFVGAIVSGFLLTAVQNWTNIRAIHGRALSALFLLWLAARVLMITGLAGFEWLVAVVDVSFFIVTGALMGHLVYKSNSTRNYQFIPILILLSGANLLTHLSAILGKPEYFQWGMYTAVFLITLIMTIVAGRVIPIFTANGIGIPPKKANPWIENIALTSMWLIGLLYITNLISIIHNTVLAILFLVASIANLFRVIRWYQPTIFAFPLVWSLHVAYCFVPIGLMLFFLHYLGFSVNTSTALHSLTAGAMSVLILAMISRVSLGHSGRKLLPKKIMTYAFIFIGISGLIRIIAGFFPIFSQFGYIASVAFWVLAYGIFIVVYFKILISPRADGKPG